MDALAMIRAATTEDVPRIVEMGCHFLADSLYADSLAENPGQMAALAQQLIDADAGALLVAEIGGDLVGMIGLLTFRHHFSGEPIAGEVVWWVEPSHRGVGVRLMKRAEQWAKANGAVRMQMIAPMGAAAGPMYERMGYRAIETAYERTL